MEHARMLHQQMCAAVLEDSHTLHSIYRTALLLSGNANTPHSAHGKSQQSGL